LRATLIERQAKIIVAIRGVPQTGNLNFPSRRNIGRGAVRTSGFKFSSLIVRRLGLYAIFGSIFSAPIRGVVSPAWKVARVPVTVLSAPDVVNSGDVLQDILKSLRPELLPPFLLRHLHRAQVVFAHHAVDGELHRIRPSGDGARSADHELVDHSPADFANEAVGVNQKLHSTSSFLHDESHGSAFCPPVNDLDEGGESDEEWPVEKGAAADVNR